MTEVSLRQPAHPKESLERDEPIIIHLKDCKEIAISNFKCVSVHVFCVCLRVCVSVEGSFIGVIKSMARKPHNE